MEYELKTPIQVHNNEAGEMQEHHKVTVEYRGKKGLKAIKGLQDIIFKTMHEVSESSSKKEKETEKEAREDSMKSTDILKVVDIAGNSERVFDAVMKTMKDFGSVGGKALSESMQESMDIEDIEGLYKAVMQSFLSPRVSQMLNSIEA